MKLILSAVVLSFMVAACSSETPSTPEEPAVYDATPYVIDTKGLPPPPPMPADNQLTVQGVKLGEMLFNEKMLSKDNSQRCASCHVEEDAFSDTRRFSIGVEGLPGKRQAMSVFNMAYHRPGFFWDGRARTLREQALMPIQDPLEMNETLPNVVAKLQASKTYRDQFIRAFNTDTITSARIGLALEQFMLSIFSGNSKWDKVQRGEATFTPSEERGRQLFFTEVDPPRGIVGGECFHCHGGPNFSNSAFMNNGLDTDASMTDLGVYAVSGNNRDKGRFKVTSLRNIALTPPYMHDGRFATLEEVIDHYNTGVKPSSTVEPLLQFNLRPGGLGLSEQDKADLVTFLKALTE
jgi:cytochrome c peroxidase